MYWFPAILIFCELIFFMSIPNLMKALAFNNFLKEIKKERNRESVKLNSQSWANITKPVNYPDLPNEKNVFIPGFYYLLFLIYFIIGLFYPIWWLSLIVFSLSFISVGISKLIRDKSFDCFLDLDDFENESVIPQKLERKLKLNSVDGSYKTKRTLILTKEYLFSLIRIGVCISIIVLHQYSLL